MDESNPAPQRNKATRRPGNGALAGAVHFPTAPVSELTVNFGHNRRDNEPVSETLDVDTLFDRLRLPNGSTKDGTYFQLVSYRDGARRNKAGVDLVYGYVGDVDSGDLNADDLRDALHRYRCLAYSTFSSREGDKRWRFVVPFTEAVPVAVFEATHTQFFAKALDVDARSGEAAQLWYRRREHAPERRDKKTGAIIMPHDECFETEGELFDALAFAPLAKPGRTVCVTPAAPADTANTERTLDTKTIAEIESALRHIDGCSRDTWLKVGMALHSTGDTAAWEIFDRWSRRFESYDAARNRVDWESFRNDGRRLKITLSSLFYIAIENGWTNPLRLTPIHTPLVSANTPRINPTDPLAWTSAFELTDEETMAIQDPEYLYPDLVIRGHIVIICAAPNAGKSTIMLKEVCPRLVERGAEVVYVHADTSGGDAKSIRDDAKRHRYRLLTPDLKGGGTSMQDVIKNLRQMAAIPDVRYDKVVVVLDTLKKCTDLIQKNNIKEFMGLLRQLTGRGMTVIALSHTNKYKDSDGKPIFEGTGDLRSDTDELIYLIPQKHADGSMTVSTDPDADTAKKRGNHKPITFTLSRDREVSREDTHIDVSKAIKEAREFEADEDVINAINASIDEGNSKQTDIVAYCKKTAEISSRQTQRCLRVYSQRRHSRRQWLQEAGFANNTKTYKRWDNVAITS